MRAQIHSLRFLLTRPLAFALGDFYSPIYDLREVLKRYRDPAALPYPPTVAGIDLSLARQVKLWDDWRPLLAKSQVPFADGRYKPSNHYGIGDAIIYACMLRWLRPSRIIEVGSGSSSALALDVRDYFKLSMHMTFIEPYPKLLNSLLKPEDHESVDILPSGVQEVPRERFDDLRSGDLLFIDSTHIVKTGSDVLFELFEVLPRLKPGVVVHFHDCYYPFEYPRAWVEKNFGWNELYAIRAFLTDNDRWEILFFNDFFAKFERDRIERDAPEVLRNPGGGLWLRKMSVKDAHEKGSSDSGMT
jgi:hypothetical protein